MRRYEKVIETITASTRPMRLTFCAPDILLRELEGINAATGGELSHCTEDQEEQVEAEPTIEESSHDDSDEDPQSQPHASSATTVVLESLTAAGKSAESADMACSISGRSYVGGESSDAGKMSPLGDLDWEKGVQSILGDKFSAPSEQGSAAHDKFLAGGTVRCDRQAISCV